VLDSGSVEADTDAAHAVSIYQKLTAPEILLRSDLAKAARTGTGDARFIDLKVQPIDEKGKLLPAAYCGCRLLIEVQIACKKRVSFATVGVGIYDVGGYQIIDANTANGSGLVNYEPGKTTTVRFVLENLLLRPATYVMSLWTGRHGDDVADFIEQAGAFEILQDPTDAKNGYELRAAYQCKFQSTVTYGDATHQTQTGNELQTALH
jgi:hypothetical protein